MNVYKNLLNNYILYYELLELERWLMSKELSVKARGPEQRFPAPM